MAGIVGIVGRDADHDKVNRMLEAVRHRGPRSCEVFDVAGGVVGIAEMAAAAPGGHRDSEASSPTTVLLDGIVYNKTQPGMSDAAFVRELYRRSGAECFGQIDGSFSCAIIDGERTIIARDAVGARPMVYGVAGDGALHFASEAKALREDLDTVEELPPGSYFCSRTGLKEFTPYTPPVPDFDGPEEAVRVLRELVVRAVEKTMADGTVEGVALSGGLDSSIVLAVARELTPDLRAFSATIKDTPGEDLEYAQLMARAAGVPLEVYAMTAEDIAAVIPKAVWHLESFDEDCVSGFIANYYTSHLASQWTDRVLVGEGADELFGGYFRELTSISDAAERERVARKLLAVAYNTALRRLDRAWTANSVDYRAPFLDAAVVAYADKIPLDLKVYVSKQAPDTPVEKWILREAFREMLPREIAERPKLRFARGVGVDALMDRAVAGAASEEELASTPASALGLTFGSAKELHFYRLLREFFPAGYERLTARWDPFK